jgi:hypothetical protein
MRRSIDRKRKWEEYRQEEGMGGGIDRKGE